MSDGYDLEAIVQRMQDRLGDFEQVVKDRLSSIERSVHDNDDLILGEMGRLRGRFRELADEIEGLRKDVNKMKFTAPKAEDGEEEVSISGEVRRVLEELQSKPTPDLLAELAVYRFLMKRRRPSDNIQSL